MTDEDKRRSDGRSQSDNQGNRETGSVNNQGRREQQISEETRSQGNQPPPERPKPKR